MAQNENRASRVAMALQKQFGGNLTLDEVYTDTISGCIFWLRAITMYFNEKQGKGTDVSQESVMWRVANGIIANLPPHNDQPEILKWYVLQYEFVCRLASELACMLFDKIKEENGNAPLRELNKNLRFLSIREQMKSLEDQINKRLVSDGFGDIAENFWSDLFKEGR